MKNKILKIISNILLVGNPFCGFFFFAFLVGEYWYITPLFIGYIVLTLKFHFYTHKEEHDAYDIWGKEFKKTHTYLGEEPYGGGYVWENKLTGKIIYL